MNTSSDAGSGPVYSDSGIAATLSLLPFSHYCKLRDRLDSKPLTRGRYNGLCGGDPSHRDRVEDFETIALRTTPASPHRVRELNGAVEAYSRSAAGKVIDPRLQRTPLALEKTMHFLVEHYLRVPHTSLVYTDPFRIWGYLWDRFRGIRTTWGPQLPPSNVSLCGYVDSETAQPLSGEQLSQESYRRVRWLEFTVAALAVGGAYLCLSEKGCQRFMQDKKQFLESISQCFTDLIVFYRAEQRHRNAELFSVLLLLYGLNQELKVEDRATFCRFESVVVNEEPRLIPESASASVNLAQVYRELEKQPWMLETQPVRMALALIQCWTSRLWFRFFERCQDATLTPLQRAVIFQSFTYARYRAVLDLVLPNYLVYPKLRVRQAIPVEELAEQLMMSHAHCLEFLRRMGLSAQLQHDQTLGQVNATIFPWHLLLCHSDSKPLVSADELEERCPNKRVLFLPTYPDFFGFRVWRAADGIFPDAEKLVRPATQRPADSSVSFGASNARSRGMARHGNATEEDDYYTDHDGDGEEGNDEAAEDQSSDGDEGEGEEVGSGRRRDNENYSNDTHLMQQLGCPINLMEVLEVYCPPFNEEVSSLELVDTSQQLFEHLRTHRRAMLRRCRRTHLSSRHWNSNHPDGINEYDSEGEGEEERVEMQEWVDKMGQESVSTCSSIFNSDDGDHFSEGEEGEEEEGCVDSSHEAAEDAQPEELLAALIEARRLLRDVKSTSLYAEAMADQEAQKQRRAAAAAATAVKEEEGERRQQEEPSQTQTATTASMCAVPSRQQSFLALPATPACEVTPISDSEADDRDSDGVDRRAEEDASSHAIVESPASVIGMSPASFPAHGRGSTREDSVETVVAQLLPSTSPDSLTTSMQKGATVPMSKLFPNQPGQQTSMMTGTGVFGRPSIPPLKFSTAMPPAIFSPAATAAASRHSGVAVEDTQKLPPVPSSSSDQDEDDEASPHTPNDDPDESSGASSAPQLGYSHLKAERRSHRDGDSTEDDDEEEEKSAAHELSLSAGEEEEEEEVLDEERGEEEEEEGISEAHSGESSNGEIQTSEEDEDSSKAVSRPRVASASPAPAPRDLTPLHITSPTPPQPWQPPQKAPEHRVERAFSIEKEAARGDSPISSSGGRGGGVRSADKKVTTHGLYNRHLFSSRSRSPAATRRKRRRMDHVNRTVAVTGATATPIATVVPSPSSPKVNVFASVYVPIVTHYLQIWTQLVHGDTEVLHQAAEGIVASREGDTVLEQQRCRAMAHTLRTRARRLLTAAALRSSMSESGLCTWDTILHTSSPSFASAAAAGGFGSAKRQAGHHPGAQVERDDVLAQQFSCGCTAALLSPVDVQVLLAVEAGTVTTVEEAMHDTTSPSQALAKSSMVQWSPEGEVRQTEAVLASFEEAMQFCETSLSTSCTSQHPSDPTPADILRAALCAASVTAQAARVRDATASPQAAAMAAAAPTLRGGGGARVVYDESIQAHVLWTPEKQVPAHQDPFSPSGNAGATTTTAAGMASAQTQVLQLTSAFIWVCRSATAEQSLHRRFPTQHLHNAYIHGDRLANGNRRNHTERDSRRLDRLSTSAAEQWLMSLLLPSMPSVQSGYDEDEEQALRDRQGNAQVQWLRLPNKSGNEEDDRGERQPAQGEDAGAVARLYLCDQSHTVTLAHTNASAGDPIGPTVPLMTRVCLYGCAAHLLPRLRLRRDGNVRLLSPSAGHSTSVPVLQNSEEDSDALSAVSCTPPAVSHQHYTAIVTVDLSAADAVLGARASLLSIVDSHSFGHAGAYTVSGVLLCVLTTDSAADAVVSELRFFFSSQWEKQHGRSGTAATAAGRQSTSTTRSLSRIHAQAPAPPAMVDVRVDYGDSLGAAEAMEDAMTTLMSGYAQQAVMVLGEA